MSEHLPQDPVCLDLYGPHDPRFRSCAGCNAYRRVREDERGNMQADIDLASYLLGRRNGYFAALRDAVEAVKALPDVTPDDLTWQEAVRAIRALGGER